MAQERGMIDGGESEVIIEINPETQQLVAWCATLRELGMYECPLLGLDGGPRRCEDCMCG